MLSRGEKEEEEVNPEEMARCLFNPMPEWAAAARSTCIGGSDIAAILGLHPYLTPYAVWAEKKGLMARELTEPMVHGLNLEAYIARLYAAVTEREDIARAQRMVDPRTPQFAATPDFHVARLLTYVECKNVGYWAAQRFGPTSDAVPDEYVCQAQWQLGIPRPDKRVYAQVDFAVLITGCEFRIYTIKRDDELIAELRRRAYAWWERHILNDEPPEVTDSPVDTNILGKRYPTGEETVVYATAEINDEVAALASLKQNKSELESQIRLRENRIKQFMGDAGRLLSDAAEVRWLNTVNGQRRFTLHVPQKGELQ